MKKLSFLLVVLALLPLAPASALEDDTNAGKKPSLLQRLNPFRKSTPAEEKTTGAAQAEWQKLELKMSIEPLPIKLAEARQMKVQVLLTNRSKKFVQLEFPTTQRIEVLVRGKDGKLVEQWSEDQAFTPEPGLVAVNAGEKLEYVAMVATRDLVAGEAYVVEAFFPNYEGLKVQTMITPEQ